MIGGAGFRATLRGFLCVGLMVSMVLSAPNAAPSGLLPRMPTIGADFPLVTADGASAIAFLNGQTSFYDGKKWSLVCSFATGYDISSPLSHPQVDNHVHTDQTAAGVVGKYAFILGGGGQEPTNNCTQFSFVTKTFASCKSMLTARSNFGIGVVDGVLYAVGGYAARGWQTVESYNTTNEEWHELPALPTPRYGLMVEAVGSKVYAIGGVAWHIPAATSNEVFDTTTMTWSAASAMPSGVAFAASAVMDKSIYILGGNDGTEKVNTVFVYDTVADSWSKAAEAIHGPARSHLSACGMSGYILVAGGAEGTGLGEHSTDEVDAYP